MLGAGYAFGQGPPEQKDLRISAGVMGFGNTELLYTDEGGGNFKAFPLMLLEYKSFYWKATEIGYEWNVKPWIQVVPFAQFLGGLGLTGIYRFAEKWVLIATFEAQVISDEIKDSPIVRNRTVLSAGTGISYRF